VCRDALPASVAKEPIIGVAAGTLGTIRLLVAGARVDDGEIAEDSDDHIVLADVLDRGATTDLRKKGLAVGEGAIGVGVEEIGREVGVKPGDVGFIHGTDVVAIEVLQSRALLFVVGHGSTPRRCDDQSQQVSGSLLTVYRQERTKSLNVRLDAKGP
jgi:hypothetical protein